jgi:hypothetical protein
MVPPFDTNPLTMMWHLVITSQILVSNFLEYIKLVELAMVQIIGNMEDEKCLLTLVFMKSKLHNKFTIHFPIVVCMLHYNFTLWRISRMLNVLSNGVQHDIEIALMVRL